MLTKTDPEEMVTEYTYNGVAAGQNGTILSTTNGGFDWNIVQTGWMLTYNAAHMVTAEIAKNSPRIVIFPKALKLCR